MHRLRVQDCSVSFESDFEEPVFFPSLDVQKISRALLDSFKDYGLRPADITLDKRDELLTFLYRVTLFNALVEFTLTSTRIEAVFKSVNRSQDRSIAHQCLQRFFGALPEYQAESCSVNVFLHAGFASNEERDRYLVGLATSGFDQGGILAYKKDLERCRLLRLEIDQSWGYANCVFLHWRAMGVQTAYLLSEKDAWNLLFDTVNPFGVQITPDE